MNTAIVHAYKQAHRHRHTQAHRHIQTDTYTRVQDDCVLARAHVLVSRCSRVSVLVSVLVRVCACSCMLLYLADHTSPNCPSPSRFIIFKCLSTSSRGVMKMFAINIWSSSSGCTKERSD